MTDNNQMLQPVANDYKIASDETMRRIRSTTKRWKLSLVITTNDSAIDNRLISAIWKVLDTENEILESMSIPTLLSSKDAQYRFTSMTDQDLDSLPNLKSRIEELQKDIEELQEEIRDLRISYLRLANAVAHIMPDRDKFFADLIPDSDD